MYVFNWYTIKIHPRSKSTQQNFIFSLFINLFYKYFEFFSFIFYLFLTITVTPNPYPRLVRGSQVWRRWILNVFPFNFSRLVKVLNNFTSGFSKMFYILHINYKNCFYVINCLYLSSILTFYSRYAFDSISYFNVIRLKSHENPFEIVLAGHFFNFL